MKAGWSILAAALMAALAAGCAAPNTSGVTVGVETDAEGNLQQVLQVDNAKLAKQSERNGEADCRVGLEARGDSENGCHDAADDGVRRLSASDRHVADRHELIGTTHEKTGVEVAKDKTDDGAGDDGLIERLEEVELVDCRDERDDEDQSDLDDRVFHLAPPFKMNVRTLDFTYRMSGFHS